MRMIFGFNAGLKENHLAQACSVSDILEIAQSLNIPEEHIELHGKTTAKVSTFTDSLLSLRRKL